MDDKERAELDLIAAQTRRYIIEAQKMNTEDLLNTKRLRWYEVIVLGGLCISAGIGIAEVFLR